MQGTINGYGERCGNRSIKNQWDPFLKEYRDYEYLPVGKNNFKNFLEKGYITNNNVNVFAGEYQSEAHKYTEKMFGDSKIFRAGTIGTIQDNTALSLVGKFFEQEQRKLSEKSYYKSPVKRFDFANMKKFQKKIVGVKRTTGQHPGGIMIVPNDKSIFNFTPIQYPADDASSGVKTTHFNYKVLSGKILKLDLLGHDVPSIIKELSNFTGVDAVKIPLDDKKTMEIFSSVDRKSVV